MERARIARLPHPYLRYRYLRWRRKSGPRLFREGKGIARRQDGYDMVVDGADIIDFCLYFFGVWEPQLTELIRRHLRPGDCAVDIGANIGAHALTMAHAVGERGRVLAMEPGPETFARLKQNVERNHLRWVDIRRQGAGAAPGVAVLHRPLEGDRGRSSVVIAEGRRPEAEVEIVAAASVWAEWRRTRLIKIDVEGAERAVLAGLAPAFDLAPDDCVLVVEASPPAPREQAARFDVLLAPLLARGFTAYALENRCDLRFMLAPRPYRLIPADFDALARTTDVALMRPSVAAALGAESG